MYVCKGYLLCLCHNCWGGGGGHFAWCIIRLSINKYREHVQLRSGVQKRPYFENSGPNWSKLGTFVDKYHTLHVIDLIFG